MYGAGVSAAISTPSVVLLKTVLYLNLYESVNVLKSHALPYLIKQ